MNLLILLLLALKVSSFSRSIWTRHLCESNGDVVLRRPVHASAVSSEKTIPIGQAHNEPLVKPLTQKEYLIAIRNRLYSVEEQLWLHQYAKSRSNAKVEVLSDTKYSELSHAKTALLQEYPLTKLHADLHDAQQYNMTYAAMYLERLIANLQRQLPLPMNHANQIAVLSSSGQVINLMRGQGAVSHRLLPAKVSVDTEKNVKRQFQHPAFSPSGRYVAFVEMHFRPGDSANGGTGNSGGSSGGGISSTLAPSKGSKGTTSSAAVSNNGGQGSRDTGAPPRGGLVTSEVLVFEVPTDPTKYGATDSTPLFQSGTLPGAPFFVRFSPDEEKLLLLCAPNAGETGTSLVELPWRQQRREGGGSGIGADAGFSKTRASTVRSPYGQRQQKCNNLLKGSPLFFTYTTSAAKNATIIAHCETDPSTDDDQCIGNGNVKSEINEKAVYMLRAHHESDYLSDTEEEEGGGGGIHKTTTTAVRWEKISEGDPYTRWSAPICHSAGGGDNVLLVEDGWLTTRALSRWKRNDDGTPKVKRLRPVKGQVQFLVSPDGARAVVLEEDVHAGHYALTVIDGEDALDPGSVSTGRQYELPSDQLTVAFWFSPDSTKLLCLNAAGKSKEEVGELKSSFRVGLNSDMQWSVYNFPLNELRLYDTFKPTPYFMKTYVPFFTQYAQVYNPWAPDSRSFLHMTSAGLSHTPLVDFKPCLGADRWMNQG